MTFTKFRMVFSLFSVQCPVSIVSYIIHSKFIPFEYETLTYGSSSDWYLPQKPNKDKTKTKKILIAKFHFDHNLHFIARSRWVVLCMTHKTFRFFVCFPFRNCNFPTKIMQCIVFSEPAMQREIILQSPSSVHTKTDSNHMEPYKLQLFMPRQFIFHFILYFPFFNRRVYTVCVLYVCALQCAHGIYSSFRIKIMQRKKKIPVATCYWLHLLCAYI